MRFRRGDHALPDTFEQLQLRLALQQRDGAAHVRLRRVQLRRGKRHRACVHHGAEALDLAEVHISPALIAAKHVFDCIKARSDTALSSTPTKAINTMNAPLRRFVRLGEIERREIRVWIDGRPTKALEGDTLLVALLRTRGHLRHSEFGDGVRSGFCLMGACQDCWVWTEDGERLRACTTVVAKDCASPPNRWRRHGPTARDRRRHRPGRRALRRDPGRGRH